MSPGILELVTKRIEIIGVDADGDMMESEATSSATTDIQGRIVMEADD